MSRSAARVGDYHSCPMADPKPHVGGLINGPGVPSLLIGGQPAAAVADQCVCTGPPDVVAEGADSVLVGDRVLAVQGSATIHGGKIVGGDTTVQIGTTN